MGEAASKEFIRERESQHTVNRKVDKLQRNLLHEEFRRNIQEVYNLRDGVELGKGGFGSVRTVTHKATGKQFAMKTVELKQIKEMKQYRFILNEVELLKGLDHPNIVRLQEVYHTPSYLYIVMDLYTGGDLFERYSFTSERNAARIVRKVVDAIRYCHNNKVAHRDLKLENIMYEHAGPDAEIKLVDFGLGSSFEENEIRHELVGSFIYMAPEVIARTYQPQMSDMWSIGVITYCLLAGYPPFRATAVRELKEKILLNEVRFSGLSWKSISEDAKGFIRGLLEKDPSKRLTAHQAQCHPWLTCNTTRNGEVEAPLDPETLLNFKKFKDANIMKRVALGAIARTLDVEEMKHLELEFHKADVENKGTISFDNFKKVLEHSGIGQENMESIFKGLNLDKSGEVCFTEFLAAALSKRQLDETRLRYAFDRIDINHDGKIDYEDLQMMVGSDMTEQEVKAAIRQFDTKGEGRVSFGEFSRAMRMSIRAPLDALATAQMTTKTMLRRSTMEGPQALKQFAEREGIEYPIADGGAVTRRFSGGAWGKQRAPTHGGSQEFEEDKIREAITSQAKGAPTMDGRIISRQRTRKLFPKALPPTKEESSSGALSGLALGGLDGGVGAPAVSPDGTEDLTPTKSPGNTQQQDQFWAKVWGIFTPHEK